MKLLVLISKPTNLNILLIICVVYTDAGEVYVWDIGGRKCMHRFADEGCLQGTSLSVSPSHQLVACGSSSGVVNVYKTQQAMKSAAPQPVKAIMNLVTAVTSLEFNCTSQILAMSSDGKDGALKLVSSIKSLIVVFTPSPFFLGKECYVINHILNIYIAY